MSNILNKAKKAQVANLLKKLNSGGTLTDKQMEQVEEYQALLEAEQPQKENSENIFICTTAELQLMFDCTRQTISAYNKRGMPKIKHGSYNVRDCFLWYMNNMHSGPEDADSSLVGIKKKLINEQYENWRLRNKERREELLPADEVKQQWADRAASLRGSLRGLISRLVGELEGKNRTDIRAILKREIDGL